MVQVRLVLHLIPLEGIVELISPLSNTHGALKPQFYGKRKEKAERNSETFPSNPSDTGYYSFSASMGAINGILELSIF